MKNKVTTYILFSMLVFGLSSCMSKTYLSSTTMNKLELGMSKNQVEKILGIEYTIAEKRIENGHQVEVLSYRNFFNGNEYYMFLFRDNRLEEWYRDVYSDTVVKKE